MVARITDAEEARLAALKRAPFDHWVALSKDETRIIAQGDTFDEVVTAALESGEDDPLFIHVPEDWSSRIL